MPALERADPVRAHPGALRKPLLRQPRRQAVAAQKRPKRRSAGASFLLHETRLFSPARAASLG